MDLLGRKDQGDLSVLAPDLPVGFIEDLADPLAWYHTAETEYFQEYVSVVEPGRVVTDRPPEWRYAVAVQLARLLSVQFAIRHTIAHAFNDTVWFAHNVVRHGSRIGRGGGQAG